MKKIILIFIFGLIEVQSLYSQEFYVSTGISSSAITNFKFSEEQFIDNRSYDYFNLGLGVTFQTNKFFNLHKLELSYGRYGGVNKEISNIILVNSGGIVTNESFWRIEGYKGDHVSLQYLIGTSFFKKINLSFGNELIYIYQQWRINNSYKYDYYSAVKQSILSYSGTGSLDKSKQAYYFGSLRKVNILLSAELELPLSSSFSVDFKYRWSVLPIGLYESWMSRKWHLSVFQVSLLTKII